MKCAFITSRFKNLRLPGHILGRGAFGTVGLGFLKTPEIQKFLWETGIIHNIPEGVDRVVIKNGKQWVVDTLVETHKAERARQRRYLESEASVMARIHAAVPDFTPQVYGCAIVSEPQKQKAAVWVRQEQQEGGHWKETGWEDAEPAPSSASGEGSGDGDGVRYAKETVRYRHRLVEQSKIVMEYAGRDLVDRFHLWISWGETHEELAARAARVQALLIEGVLALHDAGVVHSDLKPNNITLKINDAGDIERLVFIDFGGACILKPSRDPRDGSLQHSLIEPCPSSIYTPGFINADVWRFLKAQEHKLYNSKAYKALASSDAKRRMCADMLVRFACLARIHDWYGAMGTMYRIHAVINPELRPRPKDLKENFRRTVETFQVFFRGTPFEAILRLPIHDMMNRRVSAIEVCRAMDQIYAHMRRDMGRDRSPSPAPSSGTSSPISMGSSMSLSPVP